MNNRRSSPLSTPHAESTITIRLNATQQDAVNRSTRATLSDRTRKQHNKNINSFFNFIEEQYNSNDSLIEDGTTNDLIFNVDLENVADKH